jgi:hypothetical protein
LHRVPSYHENRARSIKLSIIRCIQRALALTIFTRGDNTNEVTMEEIELLDHMLALESMKERPDLILFMVRNLMKIKDEIKEGDNITIAIFPTILAYMLKIDISGYLMLSRTPNFDLEYLIECRFIHMAKNNNPLDPDVYL